MRRISWFVGFLGLAGGLLLAVPQTSEACGGRIAFQREQENYHYFVHAGNCSRSITLVRSCTCPDEAEIIAQEYRDKDYRLVWIKTTPETY